MCKSIYPHDLIVNDRSYTQLLDNMDEDEDEPHPRLREQFYAEAKKALEAEKGRISLTAVQTIGVQWT